MNRPRALVLLLGALLVNAGGCGQQDDPVTHGLPELPGTGANGLAYDPKLSTDERAAVDADFGSLSSGVVQGSRSRYFQSIFGGNSGDDVNRYLSERVKVMVSASTPVDSSVVRPAVVPTINEDEGPQVAATNVGTALWFEKIARSWSTIGLNLGGELVRVDTPRSGVIQLGSGYSKLFTPIERTGILVHEARHSDCTGGLARSDILLLRTGKLPKNPACGHIHATCPAGHPYAGLPACDDHPWGAYSVQAVYYSALVKSCPRCANRDLEVAYALAADSAERVLVLQPMLDGKLGPPDMSSVDVQNP